MIRRMKITWMWQHQRAHSEHCWWLRVCFLPWDLEFGRVTMRERRSQLTFEKAVISCKDCSLLGNGYFIFCICASNGPCQYAFTHITLSATVFDRLHCKEAACNSFFVSVYIPDHFLVTLLFLFLGEYLIDNVVFLEIILFPGSNVKSNQYLYFIQI